MEEIVITIIYFLVGLLSSLFGSIAGIGGGVIIKPILDFRSDFDVASINILSSTTVFLMATVSVLVIIYARNTKIHFKISGLLALSSIAGGVIGKQIFNTLINHSTSLAKVSLLQSIILALLMLLIFIYQRQKHQLRTFELQHASVIILIGFILGNIAAFLGIGGGPLNVAVLVLGFSMNAKEASVNSLFIIFFSQLSSLVTTGLTTGFSIYSLETLPYIAVGGVLGGIIGSFLLCKSTNRRVEMVFSLAIIVVFLINVINVVKVFPQL